MVRSVRRFRSIILIKSLIKSIAPRAVGRRNSGIDFNLINAMPVGKQRDKSASASVKSCDNSVPYGGTIKTNTIENSWEENRNGERRSL